MRGRCGRCSPLDVAVGLATALLVLVGATLLARVIAGAAAGDSLADVSGELVALAVVFALRGVSAWAFEVAGRRAAATTLSELRLALVGGGCATSRPRWTGPRPAS